jgi:phosphohistidine phosphatase SixA
MAPRHPRGTRPFQSHSRTRSLLARQPPTNCRASPIVYARSVALWVRCVGPSLSTDTHRPSGQSQLLGGGMDMILVRHGTGADERHTRTLEAGDRPELSPRGNHVIERLADALRIRKVRPDLVLSSKKMPALASAELLRNALAPSADLTELDALTPRRGSGELEELYSESRSQLDALRDDGTILIVGHEGRLSNLLTQLTGRRLSQLPHGGAVCVRADRLLDLLTGLGEVRFRYPVVDHLEEQLRPKITSKMTVASVLAGFVLTALSAILVLDVHHWDRVLAVTCLTISLVLFVASVLIFDQLSMPSGFWTDTWSSPAIGDSRWRARLRKEREKLIRLGETSLEKRWERKRQIGEDLTERQRRDAADEDPLISRIRNEGPALHLMVATSRWVFLPAIVLAAIGLMALLMGTGEPWIWALGLLGLVVSAGYAYWNRPELGAD